MVVRGQESASLTQQVSNSSLEPNAHGAILIQAAYKLKGVLDSIF